MSSRDLFHRIKAVKSILSILGNNTTEGTGLSVDTAGFESAMAVFNIGQSGDTLSGSVYMTLSVQESDNGSTGWADVPAANIIGSNQGLVIDAAAEDEVIVHIGVKGAKRYLRAMVAFTGTHTNGCPIGAEILLGAVPHEPAQS